MKTYTDDMHHLWKSLLEYDIIMPNTKIPEKASNQSANNTPKSELSESESSSTTSDQHPAPKESNSQTPIDDAQTQVSNLTP